MPALVFGILVLVLAIWALNVISKIDPKIGARVMKAGGGILALGLAVFLGLRGELAIGQHVNESELAARLAAVRPGGFLAARQQERRRRLARALGLYRDGARP